MKNPALSWLGIFRLGLVQAGLGAIVVLTTSTLNRVMVVELAMPAMLPGALVAVHYALQAFRPAWGHGSDLGARRTPWIIGGMAVLATGGLLAAVATAWMTTHPLIGIALAVVAFCLIGFGYINFLRGFGSFRLPSGTPIASLYVAIPLSGVLIALFTVEQLVNGIRNGFEHPEPPEQDLPPAKVGAQTRVGL